MLAKLIYPLILGKSRFVFTQFELAERSFAVKLLTKDDNPVNSANGFFWFCRKDISELDTPLYFDWLCCQIIEYLCQIFNGVFLRFQLIFFEHMDYFDTVKRYIVGNSGDTLLFFGTSIVLPEFPWIVLVKKKNNSWTSLKINVLWW